MIKINTTFVSRSSAVEASRVGTIVTWPCPVAEIAPLSGQGSSYIRRSGNISEPIIYPHHLTTKVKIKRLQHSPVDQDYSHALAWEFFESTCIYREKFLMDCRYVRGIADYLEFCEQQKDDWKITPVSGSPYFMEAEFSLRVPPK